MRHLAILTVKNEAAFLLEWLAHHRATGFGDFLVFSNDCADGTDTMLDRLQAMGWLTHIRNDGPHDKGAQWTALSRAAREPAFRGADWAMVLDIDEFVNIHVGDHTLGALHAALPEATAITLTWRLFGNGGIVGYDDRPVSETFTRAIAPVFHWPWRAAMFKTLYRADGSYGKPGVHRPRQPDPDRVVGARWFDGAGQALPESFAKARVFSDFGRNLYLLAQLNHYALGAMESYIVKCDRGAPTARPRLSTCPIGANATLPRSKTPAFRRWRRSGGLAGRTDGGPGSGAAARRGGCVAPAPVCGADGRRGLAFAFRPA
ncbi:MAG: glycosyltransferase family 2 protein [Paracoccaceae bacterium]